MCLREEIYHERNLPKLGKLGPQLKLKQANEEPLEEGGLDCAALWLGLLGTKLPGERRTGVASATSVPEHPGPEGPGYTIMGKTADLTVVQKTITDTLHKEEKPLAQGPPGGILGILGVVVVFGLIVGVMVTICMVYKRGQKTSSETDNDLTEMPPMHKPAPPPTKKNCDMKGGLISDDIQEQLLGHSGDGRKNYTSNLSRIAATDYGGDEDDDAAGVKEADPTRS
ncbi:hypothetical protein QTP86_002165 [Hemibagrus guttatus]|nr:hypothetical protein QTP86_002165 [Hemibagrus guttatus]